MNVARLRELLKSRGEFSGEPHIEAVHWWAFEREMGNCVLAQSLSADLNHLIATCGAARRPALRYSRRIWSGKTQNTLKVPLT